MGNIKEIFEVWVARIRVPLFGYFSLAFLGTNWKAIFYLFFSDSDALTRIEFFEASTCLNSMLWIPLGISIVAALGYPWIQLALMFATSMPNRLRNTMHAKAESDLLMIKLDLESSRNELARQKERRIIEKANIDEEIESIGDQEARQKAKDEILAARQIGDVLYDSLSEESLEEYLLSRFPGMPIDKRITKLFLRDVNRNRYKTIDDIHKVLKESEDFIEFYKRQNPDVFKSSIDYVTKSFGFSDPEFRRKHGFSKSTTDAFDNFISA